MDTQHALVRASLRAARLCGWRVSAIPRPAGRISCRWTILVTVGPLGPADHTERMVSVPAGTGINAVVLHRGRINRVPVDAFTSIGLIVHLSAGTSMSLTPTPRFSSPVSRPPCDREPTRSASTSTSDRKANVSSWQISPPSPGNATYSESRCWR